MEQYVRCFPYFSSFCQNMQSMFHSIKEVLSFISYRDCFHRFLYSVPWNFILDREIKLCFARKCLASNKQGKKRKSKGSFLSFLSILCSLVVCLLFFSHDWQNVISSPEQRIFVILFFRFFFFLLLWIHSFLCHVHLERCFHTSVLCMSL